MSDNWVVQNLQNALDTWNSKLAEIWSLVTTTPETFKGGAIWNVIKSIYNSMQGIGLGLLVLFFLVGMIKTCGSFDEVKRPEQVFKLFIRFVLAKIVVTYGMTLMLDVFKITQGLLIPLNLKHSVSQTLPITCHPLSDESIFSGTVATS